MNKFPLLSATAVLLLIGAQSADAANFLRTCNGRPMGLPNASVAWSVSSAGFPAGSSWDTALRAAIARVNDNPSRLRMSIANNSDTSVAIGNNQNEVWFSSDASEASPAVAYNYYSCDTSTGVGFISETDVLFYNGEPYTADMTVNTRLYGYGGRMRPFQTTAVHEFGHALGLAHSNSEYNVMGTDFYFMTTNGGVARAYLGADASDGAVRIYGAASSTVQDVSLSHWKYSGASGAYSSHAKTILADASGTELSSTVDAGEKRYAVTGGQTVQLELTRENNGQTAQSVRVGYYLSSDATVTPSDTQIALDTVTANLGDPVTWRRTLTLPTGLPAGKYWLGAVIDDNNALSEAVEDNNAMYIPVSYSGGNTEPPTGNTLANGVPRTDLTAQSGQELNFVMDVPAGATNLRFAMSGGTGDADLYVRFGSAPTTTTYDCRPYANGNSETCPIANVQAGRYYVTIRAYSTFSGVSLTGSYTAGTGNNVLPVASFNSTVSGLSASLTDTSTDADGSIASRTWDFGDGTTSTMANPTKTYATAGTYTVRLTVTDNSGGQNVATRSITVSSGGTALPECTASRTDELGRNCSRSNLGASTGSTLYFYLPVPSGTSQLRITTAGGTGNADLYYSTSSWATPSNYTQRSINAGNAESITINNPPSGYVYVSVHAASSFSGLKVSTEY